MLISRLLFFIFCTTHAIAQTDTLPEPGVSLSLAQQRKALISQTEYRIRFTIPANITHPVKGEIAISFNISTHPAQIVLDFKQRNGAVQSLLVNNKPEPVHHENEHLIISSSQLVKGANKISVIFEAGSSALNRNEEYLYSLFVPEHARAAFPCFDQPDLKAIFQLSLQVPKFWKAMSNGKAIKKIRKGEYTEWQFEPSDTISTYLFAFAAGKFKSCSKNINGRLMEFLYRETDSVKLFASIDAIFGMHAQSLAFMEKYTGIKFPFKKFSFAAIPDFQFGGMEHPGAIWYHGGTLFLDSSATRTQLIRRANVIAHETAHMWFGDLVTMKWFNDVWMKEVFANFMADKIVSEMLPDDNASLKFITDHFPAAYSVDRTKGANPVRQQLGNLQEAGTLYGSIIYHKAPVMMQQLERLTGEKKLQEGLQTYLHRYAFANADWPDLVSILDRQTPEDLQAWNDRRINRSGRPLIHHLLTDTKDAYGLFDVDTGSLFQIKDPALRALNWLNLYENVIDNKYLKPVRWLSMAVEELKNEKEELIIQMLLNELQNIYWIYLSPAERNAAAIELEMVLPELISISSQPNLKKLFFKSWAGVTLNNPAKSSLYNIWKEKSPPPGVNLSDDDYTELAAILAIKMPDSACNIVTGELLQIKNPDKKARWKFVTPSLSASEQLRDSFFISLKEVKNRSRESWVNTALGYLHHPLRGERAVKYILPSLALLQDIQQTGDIFFPDNWLQATLGTHQSAAAEKIVMDFIKDHPGYNVRLLNKILQAADPLFRARKIL